MKNLLAVLKSVGMRLSVEPQNQVRACSGVGGWLRPIGAGHKCSFGYVSKIFTVFAESGLHGRSFSI